MSDERILVTGPAVRVGIVGAYLAARWLGPGRKLELAPEVETDGAAGFLTRPDVHRFHGELGLPLEQVAALCSGVPALSTPVETANGQALLPFSPIGMSNGGVEFHHYWQRAGQVSDQPDLTDFSLSLALEETPQALTMSQITRLPIEFGLKLDRAQYAKAFLSHAQGNGAAVLTEMPAGSLADLVVDCRDSDAAANWSDGMLTIGTPSEIVGMEWHVVSSAARRLAALMAPLSDCGPEQSEWTRLARAERERIADMEELLTIADSMQSKRPALLRKAQVFAACGRIPTEDYEVFSAPEWLIALWARGIGPRRYDRMADRVHQDELLGWLSQLHQQIAQITNRVQAA